MKPAIVATLFLVIRYLATRPAPSPPFPPKNPMDVLMDLIFGQGASAGWREENAKE